jgi:integrase/recombinase XerC
MNAAQWQALLDDFCLGLAPSHSPRTLASYRQDGRALIAILTTTDPAPAPAELDLMRCRALLAQLAEQGLGAVSIARHLSCFRQWFDELMHKQLCTANPWRQVRAPKREKRLPNALSPDETQRLLDHRPATPRVSHLRDQAMFELLYSSGLRVSECVGINLKDLDVQNHEVRVLGKGNKERIVPLGAQAIAALEGWIVQRRVIALGLSAILAEQLQQADAPVFISQRGQRLSARALQTLLAARGRDSGMLSAVHPHRLRHAFASHVLQSSGDLRAVQEMLGHADIKSTQVYTHLDFQHLARVYDAAHPRSKLEKAL